MSQTTQINKSTKPENLVIKIIGFMFMLYFTGYVIGQAFYYFKH